ncbi:MAG: SAM-dependent methyltransferase [Myxococcales bacterium]|nr:SAM-dependent methyltransferase [Myxococcales bacterium]
MRARVGKPDLAAEIPPEFPRPLLQDLHLLTREGHLNADARRKLKQIQHLIGLLRPALTDLLQRHAAPTVVDCGAGKSYLGFLLYAAVLAPAAKGSLLSIESRPELSTAARERANTYGFDRFTSVAATIAQAGAALPERVQLVTALHACDTATDDALVLALQKRADYIAVVPCCQAEVAQLLKTAKATPAMASLADHAWHRREFGSHLTNVIRALVLEANGYQVTVTELAGWEHSLKNELILAKRVQGHNAKAAAQLRELLTATGVEPALVRALPPPQAPPAPQAAPIV